VGGGYGGGELFSFSGGCLGVPKKRGGFAWAPQGGPFRVDRGKKLGVGGGPRGGGRFWGGGPSFCFFCGGGLGVLVSKIGGPPGWGFGMGGGGPGGGGPGPVGGVGGVTYTK